MFVTGVLLIFSLGVYYKVVHGKFCVIMYIPGHMHMLITSKVSCKDSVLDLHISSDSLFRIAKFNIFIKI